MIVLAIDPQHTKVEVDGKGWPPVKVTIREGSSSFGIKIFLEHLGRNPAFLGFEVLSDGDGLDPRSFARLARNLPRYVAHARAIALWDNDRAEALETLRLEVGKSRRGLPDEHYEEIGREYERLVADGDPHPIKTIAERRPVDKSRASRWVKEARVRGYIGPR